MEVVSEADMLQTQAPSDSGSTQHRPGPSPYVRTSPAPASLRPPGPGVTSSGQNDIRRGQVISPGMGMLVIMENIYYVMVSFFGLKKCIEIKCVFSIMEFDIAVLPQVLVNTI